MTECGFLSGKYCRKGLRDDGSKSTVLCVPSDQHWFISYESNKKFILPDKMCQELSDYGNDWIGLTEKDIDRLKNGEVVFVDNGEYGIFIGFIKE